MDDDAAIAQAAQHYGVEVNQLLGHARRDSGDVVLILPDGKKVIYTPLPEDRAVHEEEAAEPEEESSPEAPKPKRRTSRKK